MMNDRISKVHVKGTKGIKLTGFGILFVVLLLVGNIVTAEAQDNAWDQVEKIVDQIVQPVFKDQNFNILDFGAKPNEKINASEAINNAIKTCHEKGGGIVVVPKGTFYTSAIHLLSNVNLHVSEGATLLFSVDPNDYLPLVYTRWEGIDCFNYSPLIYANGQENIAITGKGMLQGNSSKNDWWIWKGQSAYGWKEGSPSQLMPHARPALDVANNAETPVEQRKMGEGFYLRPQFINFVHCKNILIENVTIENSPFWVVHPIFCQNMTVKGIHINSLGPNNDGCDPESCTNVLIEDCYFNTGDDCIALKSGRNSDGIKANIPCENIVVRHCFMKNGHGGVVIGSEISGGARNVFVEDCKMDSPLLDRAIRIKTNSNRGGIIENMYVRNIKIGKVKEAVLRINCNYDVKREGLSTFFPVVRNINLTGISSLSSKYGVLLEGIEGQNCIYDIRISNSKFDGVEKDNKIEFAKDIQFEKVYINGELSTITD